MATARLTVTRRLADAALAARHRVDLGQRAGLGERDAGWPPAPRSCSLSACALLGAHDIQLNVDRGHAGDAGTRLVSRRSCVSLQGAAGDGQSARPCEARPCRRATSTDSTMPELRDGAADLGVDARWPAAASTDVWFDGECSHAGGARRPAVRRWRRFTVGCDGLPSGDGGVRASHVAGLDPGDRGQCGGFGWPVPLLGFSSSLTVARRSCRRGARRRGSRSPAVAASSMSSSRSRSSERT